MQICDFMILCLGISVFVLGTGALVLLGLGDSIFWSTVMLLI